MPDTMLNDISHILELLASPHPAQAYRAVDALAQRVIGHRLFTVMRQLEATAEVERLYSSNEGDYPVGGRKPKQGTPWGEIVLGRGEVFIAKDAAETRAAFADHELLLRLGITSIMNIPIRHGGRVLGTMNFSHQAGHYGEPAIAPAKIMAGMLVPLLLTEPAT
jgi:GAF domain-containing protein